MVDLATIKPGDRVMLLNMILYQRKDGHLGRMDDGQILVAADPPTDEFMSRLNVLIDGSLRGCDSFNPMCFGLIESAPTPPAAYPPCTCELWFGNGCKCGAFAREREAKRAS